MKQDFIGQNKKNVPQRNKAGLKKEVTFHTSTWVYEISYSSRYRCMRSGDSKMIIENYRSKTNNSGKQRS